MKHHYTLFAMTAFLGLSLTPLALAQTDITRVESSTTSLGTISEFSPNTIIIRSETSPNPIRYSYSKTTTYVDETGAPVSIETVKSGLPVTVYYSREGENLVANKVIVRKATVVETPAVEAPISPIIEEKKTTTTTTTETQE